jgi:hypothetical protein
VLESGVPRAQLRHAERPMPPATSRISDPALVDALAAYVWSRSRS